MSSSANAGPYTDSGFGLCCWETAPRPSIRNLKYMQYIKVQWKAETEKDLVKMWFSARETGGWELLRETKF